MTTATPTVAQTILEQLGGTNKLTAMLGATMFVNRGENEGVSFRFKGCKKANLVWVKLHWTDTYIMEFYKVHRTPRESDFEPVETHDFIYAHALRRTFTEVTGLELSL